MTNEEIKTLADGYYAGNADWLNKEQEQDTKVGWRQGFAYALRQFAVSGSVCDCEPHTFYEWEKEENKCSRCNKPLVCDECGDGSGWYGDDTTPEYGSITMNCSKCNPQAIGR
jgi:hypothetical protein